MRLFRSILLLTLSLIIISCAMNVQRKDSAELRTELAKLRALRAEGIIQINYNLLSMRQSFVFAKNASELRLDIIQGGVMGMQAQPLLSVYLGDYLAIKSPIMPQLEDLDLQGMIPGSPGNILSELENLILQHEDEILRNREVSVSGVTFKFNKNYQLSEVRDAKEKIEITISYNRKNDIDILSLRQGGKELFALMVDSITYGNTEIVPLARH